MKAILLTYDGRQAFSELAIKSYARLLPEANLEFIVPYNNEIKYKDKYNNIILKQTPRFIKETVLGLLDGIPDKELVYWCLDDIYPHKIINPQLLTKLINDPPLLDADCLRLFAFPNYSFSAPIIIKSHTFFRIPYTHYDFWFHQIYKAGTLRRIFAGMPLDNNSNIREFGAHFRENYSKFNHKILVSQEPIAIFGETTRGGYQITGNCFEALKKYDISLDKHLQVIHKIFNNRRVEDLPTIFRKHL